MHYILLNVHKKVRAKMYICTEYIIRVLRYYPIWGYTYLAENVTANITENIFINISIM